MNNPRIYSKEDQYHYSKFSPQPIEIIEIYRLNYKMGNAIKYILRAEHKESKVKDLKKAIWYLERELEQEQNGTNL